MDFVEKLLFYSNRIEFVKDNQLRVLKDRGTLDKTNCIIFYFDPYQMKELLRSMGVGD